MTALWTAAELREATGGRLDAAAAVTGISIDSRSTQPGDLFIALRDARDGHDFVADALARGAAGAMVDRDPPGVAQGAPLLRVHDTLAALQLLGGAARRRSTARVVGITGSVGKTSTKEMLRLALASAGSTHAATASFNNHWGVPVTLARMPRDARFAVVEIGMNNRGEIAPLAQLARPHVVVITNIAAVHIGHLGSLEAIAEEKADILQGIEPDGIAVLPADSEFFHRLSAAATLRGARVVGFGESAAAQSRLLSWRGDAEGSEAEISLHGQRLRVKLATPGRHMAVNATAVLAAAVAMGADAEAAAAALAPFGAVIGRGLRRQIAVPGGEALLIDDSYNASPISVRAGLQVLAVQPARRRVAVLGDMRELGDAGPALHAALAPEVRAAADIAFCCGPLMQHLFDALPAGCRGAHAADSAALAPIIRAALRPGDAVLVKGSLGSRMATIVKALTDMPPPDQQGEAA